MGGPGSMPDANKILVPPWKNTNSNVARSSCLSSKHNRARYTRKPTKPFAKKETFPSLHFYDITGAAVCLVCRIYKNKAILRRGEFIVRRLP